MKLSYNIKIAYRSMLNSKSESIVNILGLAIGIAFSVIVFMYVRNESSFDKHYTDYDDVYRVVTYGKIGNRSFESAMVPNPMSEFLTDNFSEVVSSVRLVRGINKLVKYNDKQFNEDNFFYADKTFFNVFDLHFVKGDSTNALLTDSSVVVSSETAKRYFGVDDPLGKKIELDNGLRFDVKGVYEMPNNSHFHCDFIASHESISKLYKDKKYKKEEVEQNWLQLNRYVYIKLQREADVKRLSDSLHQKLGVEIDKQLSKMVDDGNISGEGFESLNFRLQKLQDIHLYSDLENEFESNSKVIYVRLFLFIAIFVLLISCVNFMNLTTAKVARRLNSIGVRKLSGFSRGQLFTQFIVEALLYSVVALFIGLVLVELLLPGFNYLFEIDLRLRSFSNRIDFFVVGLLTLLVGILSGIYPAITLSGIKEIEVLKGNLYRVNRSFFVRGALASSQILVATFLVILALGISWQLKYLNERDLGFDAENILVVERGYAIADNFKEMKSELKRISGVVDVSACFVLPGEKAPMTSFNYLGKEGEQIVLLPYNYVEKDFFKTLGINLYSGTIWSETNEKMAHDVVINMVARDSMHLVKPLGQKIRYSHDMDYEYGYNITGVVKDFHFEPIDMPVRPLLLFDLPKGAAFDNLLIKFSGTVDKEGLINSISELWMHYTHDEPFEYKYLANVLQDNLKEERVVSRMIWLFAIIAVFIAWLGLRAFEAYAGELKMAEIQIKKLIGASWKQLMWEQVFEVGQFVLAGVMISLPIAYVVLDLWIGEYAYGSILPVWLMMVTGLMIVFLSLFNIIPQKVKLAKSEVIVGEV